MKNILFLLLFSGLSAALIAQKTINDPNAEKRSVSGYHSVQVSGGIDLFLSQGTNEVVAVSASETKHRDRIKTEVVNGVLKIWYDHDSNLRIDWGNRKMKAYVSVKDIDGLGGSGGSDIEIEGIIKSPKLKLEISGGSDFEGKVDIGTLDIEQSGGSDIAISGKVTNLKVECSGGSDFSGFDLSSETCDVEASGGSDVTITVTKELNAHASGGSDIHYRGTGSLKNVKTSGSSVKKVSK